MRLGAPPVQAARATGEAMPTLVVDNGACMLKASLVPENLNHSAKTLNAIAVHGQHPRALVLLQLYCSRGTV